MRRRHKTGGVAAGIEGFLVNQVGRHLGARKRKRQHLLEGMQRCHLAIQRQQHVVDDQATVLAVGSDSADLLGRQAQVQCVHHAACCRAAGLPGCRAAEVGRQVRVLVTAQHGHAVASFQASTLQCRCQLRRALLPLAAAVAAQALVGQPRDDGAALEPRNRSWTRPSGLRWGLLAGRDDAAGCLPARRSNAASGFQRGSIGRVALSPNG